MPMTLAKLIRQLTILAKKHPELNNVEVVIDSPGDDAPTAGGFSVKFPIVAIGELSAQGKKAVFLQTFSANKLLSIVNNFLAEIYKHSQEKH